jgi:hypothetical protein
MKVLPLCIVASLALNAALAWKFLQGRAAAGSAPAAVTSAARPLPAPDPAAANVGSAGSNSPAAFPSDPVDQRDRLLALGFPPDVVRAAVRAAIEEPRLAKQREYYAQAAKQPWWRGGLVAQDITRDQQKELNALRKAERAEIARVLGPEGNLTEGDTDRYAFLDPAKAVRLATLERDYAELRRAAGEGGPVSTERTRELKENYDRELDAFLTPEERGALAARDSSTAQNLRYRFDYFAGTEQEYQALFALQKAFDDKYSGLRGLLTGDAGREMGAAMQAMTKDIESTLGPDRYAAYLLAQRSEYRALVDLRQRFDLPAAAFDQVAKVQGEILLANEKIRADRGTPAADKLAAVAALAARARTEVRTALGPDLGEKFLAATKSSWIDQLDRGNIYGASVTGGTWVGPVVPRGPAPPKQ